MIYTFSLFTNSYSVEEYLTGEDSQICLLGVCLLITYVPRSSPSRTVITPLCQKQSSHSCNIKLLNTGLKTVITQPFCQFGFMHYNYHMAILLRMGNMERYLDNCAINNNLNDINYYLFNYLLYVWLRFCLCSSTSTQ